MNKKLVKVMSLAMVAIMLFAMSAVSVFAAAAATPITNSLGAYPYPHPTEGNKPYFWGWNSQSNTDNSVWYNSSEESLYPLKGTTNGYYEGWSTSNQVTTGEYHKYGVGMHSAIENAPSTVYAIDYYKMTSFYTKVFLVQYDYDEELVDYDPVAAADPANPQDGEKIPVVVYVDRSVDGNTWGVKDETTEEVTYPNRIERTLTAKGDFVEFSLDAEDLAGYTHIKIGIATKHGIYEETTNDEGETVKTRILDVNTALASVYFADLTITQSKKVEAIKAPSIPMRPENDPKYADAYEVIKTPETDDANWFGRPYGPWMAGENAGANGENLYYLSGMTYLVSSNTVDAKVNPSGKPTSINYPYSTEKGTTFMFGAEGMEHEITNGIGMHPKNPKTLVDGRADSWTIYDISAYTAEDSETPADTFYTLVGLTAIANEWGGRLKSAGVYVYIYGDKTGDGGHYELLAASELVKGYNLGEFNVNIEGVKLLLIDVILPEEATAESYSGIGFGNACLFMADENAVKPDYSNEKPAEEEWEDEDTATAPTTTKPTTTPATEPADEGKKGCGGVVTGAAGILFATVVAGAACFGKRRDEE